MVRNGSPGPISHDGFRLGAAKGFYSIDSGYALT